MFPREYHFFRFDRIMVKMWDITNLMWEKCDFVFSRNMFRCFSDQLEHLLMP